MTINQIIERFKTDTAFAEKYSALNGMDAILEQAKADGFDVTAADVQAAMNELGKKSGELSEADLAAVAGGTQNKLFGDICYCKPSGEQEFRNNAMRIKCSQNNCLQRRLKNDNTSDLADFWCKCYGNDRCIGMWHIDTTCQ